MQNPPTQRFTESMLAAVNPAIGPHAMQWKVGTNQGPRKDNQDCAIAAAPGFPAIQSKGVLLVMCDGVGGEEGGHIASQAAANEAMHAYYNDGNADIGLSLIGAIERANAAVQRESAANPRFARMATTVVLAAVHNGLLHVAHVGDSRAYLLRNGQLIQLTHDHTFANAQVASGGMTQEQAQRSIYRGTLVRSLGMLGDHTPDGHVEQLTLGDRVLLCSDGLHGSVPGQQIVRILNDNPDAGAAVSQLIGAAISNQTADNVSAIVLNYGEVARTAVAAAAGGRPKLLIPVVAVAVLALFAAGIVLSGVLKGGSIATPTPASTSTAPTPPTATALALAPAAEPTTAATEAVPAPVATAAPQATTAPTVAVTSATTAAPATEVPAQAPPTATETPRSS